MTMSDISGIAAIRRSIADRGTSTTVVSLAARIGSDHVPPDSSEISLMNWVGPSVEGTRRSPVNGLTTSISPSSTYTKRSAGAPISASIAPLG